MHILIIPSWYPTPTNLFHGNFVERHVHLLAQQYQLTVLNFITSEKVKEIDVQEKKEGNLTEFNIFYPKKGNKFFQLLSLRKAFNQVVQSIESVDLIHLHVILDKGFIGGWAQKYFDKPMVVTEHASYLFPQNFNKLSSLQRRIIQKTIRKSVAISCVSPLLEQQVKILFPAAKTMITPNSIQGDLFSLSDKPKQDSVRFIHVSTLDDLKNVTHMIRAFEKLNETFSDFTFTIIGEKKNEKIEQQVANSTIREKIKLTGPCLIEEVADQIKKSDALVMLSDYETFSCVIAESWSCGVPVISTEVGIAVKMDEKLGIIVKNTSAEELLLSLKNFISKRNAFRAEVIRNYTNQYSEESVLHSFNQLYQLAM